MIAPDANLLIYAYQTTSPFHAQARQWIEKLYVGEESIGIPILSVYGFLRFMTNPKINPKPATYSQANAIVDSWLAIPKLHILYPGDRHLRLMHDLSRHVRIAGSDVTDLAIAAIAIEYGAIVHTHDRGFARFPGLRWQNPLAQNS